MQVFNAAAHVALNSDTILHCYFDKPLMFEEDLVVATIDYVGKWGNCDA